MPRKVAISIFLALMVFGGLTSAEEVYWSGEGQAVVMLSNPYSDWSRSRPAGIKPRKPRINRLPEYESIVDDYARFLGLDPALIKAIILTESAGDPEAISPKGAVGLMQLMPETAKALGVDPHDPEENILGGIKYFAQMLVRFDGDLLLALAAYNAGPGAVEKHGGIPPYTETMRYVVRVYRTWQRIQD